MNIIVKTLLIFVIVCFLSIFLFIGFFKSHLVCKVFTNAAPSPHAEMIRQVQLKADCGHLGKTPIPIHKYIIDNNKIVGAISGTTLILKGTDTYWDLIKDLIAKPGRFYEGHAHRGVLEVYKRIRPQIINEDIRTITGWSLGASVGTLAGYDIYKTHGSKPMLHLYAPIPTVDTRLKKAYDKALYSQTKLYINPFDYISYTLTGKYGHRFVDSLARLHHVGGLQQKYPYTTARYFFPHISYM
jgi:hypothetical protein